MSQRPELNKETDTAAFRSNYYLKQELAGFCRENGLPTSGSKAELTDRIAYFLDTGNVLRSSAERKTAVNIGTLTEDTVIEPNIVCSEKHRAFFSEKNRKRLFFQCSVSEMAESKRRKDLRRRDSGVLSNLRGKETNQNGDRRAV